MYYLIEKHKKFPKEHYVIIGKFFFRNNDEISVEFICHITGETRQGTGGLFYCYPCLGEVLDKDRSLKKLKERIAISLL